MKQTCLCAQLIVTFLLSLPAAASYGVAELPAQLRALWSDAESLGSQQETALKKNAVGYAASLYRLEHRALALHELAGSASFPNEMDREVFRDETETLLQVVYRLQGRALDVAVERLNVALPGKDGAQLLRSYAGQDVYQANFRAAERLPYLERRQRLEDQRREFYERGGEPSDIRNLDYDLIEAVAPGQLVEWVKVGKRFRATTTNAGHVIIGAGRSARGAGGLKIWREPDGSVSLAVVSNWSGNYKPGIGVNFALMRHLGRLGIPHNRMLVTETTPDDPVIAGLLLKAQGISKDQIKAKLAKMMARASHDVEGIRAGKRPPRLGHP